MLGLVALTACTAATGADEALPFVGTWDCRTTRLTLTAQTFDEGSGPVAMAAVEQERGFYTLFLRDGRRIGLGAVTAAGLNLAREGSRDSEACRRTS
jgi:hypothetical protein